MPGLWAAAGSPGLVVLGDEFPFQIEASSREALATTLDPKMMTFDLRAGRYARRGAGWPTGARALAATAAVACIGHLSLLGLDIVALQRNVVAQETKVRQALDKTGAPVTGDVDSALTAALATQIPAKTGGFLPLLAQSFSAISAQAGLVQVKDMRFSQANAALTLTIEAPDLTALQAIETAFVAAGLQVAAGAATTGDGAAEAQMIVSAAAP